MPTVRVRITQQDIDEGRPGDPCNCPGARAVCRALGKRLGLVRISFNSLIRVFKDSRDGGHSFPAPESIATPDVMRDFIRNYDSLKAVEPIECDLVWETPLEDTS